MPFRFNIFIMYMSWVYFIPDLIASSITGHGCLFFHKSMGMYSCTAMWMYSLAELITCSIAWRSSVLPSPHNVLGDEAINTWIINLEQNIKNDNYMWNLQYNLVYGIIFSVINWKWMCIIYPGLVMSGVFPRQLLDSINTPV